MTRNLWIPFAGVLVLTLVASALGFNSMRPTLLKDIACSLFFALLAWWTWLAACRKATDESTTDPPMIRQAKVTVEIAAMYLCGLAAVYMFGYVIRDLVTAL
jgi:hypothetical protein